MNTSVRLNHQLLTTSTFDSGALGMLASVVHQFPPGRYHAIVQRDGQEAGTTRFLVDDSSATMQLAIDLAAVAGPWHGPAGAGASEASAAVQIPTVSSKGYVLFHVSGGPAGYAVAAREESSGGQGFDSAALSDGDLFAVSLLEPATYAIANQSATASGEIEVTPVPEGTNPRTLPAQHVDVNSDSFDPTAVSVHSGQGLVFHIRGGPARVVINKHPAEELSAASREAKPVRRRVHLRKLR